MQQTSLPRRRISSGVEGDQVAAVADERRVEQVSEKLGAVDGFHGGAETARRGPADVAVHGVERVRHRVNGVDDEAKLRVLLSVVRLQRLVSCNGTHVDSGTSKNRYQIR